MYNDTKQAAPRVPWGRQGAGGEEELQDARLPYCHQFALQVVDRGAVVLAEGARLSQAAEQVVLRVQVVQRLLCGEAVVRRQRGCGQPSRQELRLVFNRAK